MKLRIDETEIRKAIAIMKPDNQLFEVRYIGNSGRLNFSGYFTDVDVLIDKLNRLNPTEAGNVYITLNEINTACYSRAQRDKFNKNPKNSTSDNDIVGYDWLMLDFDPKRPAGTAASEDELKIAHEVAQRVYRYLSSKGWQSPVIAMSGNGYHLLYKVYLANAKEKSALVERTLKALNMLFGDEDSVSVDTAVFNPSRICKLYGTEAVKGSNTKDRPHRMAKILYAPDEIKENDVHLLEEIANEIPEEPEQPQKYNNYNPRSFDLEKWLDEHGVVVTQKASFKDGTKYILEECPFDSSHRGKDACVIQFNNGALCFHCFHQSCADKDWKAFREHFEPTAYQKREYHQPNRLLPDVPSRQIKAADQTEAESVFFTPEQIRQMKTPPEEFIKTGIRELDVKIGGLKKGFVTCLSGLRASGKSSIISQISLEAVKSNYRVALYSGELAPKNLLKWLVLQAAGKDCVFQRGDIANYFVPMAGVDEQVCEWIGDRLLIYNNDYGSEFGFIEQRLDECVEEHKVDLIILDNLMMIDISELNDNFYRAQGEFVKKLEIFAKKNNVHVLFVAHPRKSQGFLRLDDISGSNDIVNQVDNAFILHRVNKDFERLTQETLKWTKDNKLYEASNVIEVCKDRDGGVQDLFIPLYFEMETKRLKNNINENKIYGDGGFHVDNADFGF